MPEVPEIRKDPVRKRGEGKHSVPEVKPVKRSQTEILLREIWMLLIKVAAIVLAAVLIFTFMFGIYRCTDPSMVPSIKDGDLVIFYRVDKLYTNSDVTVADYDGRKIALRVVARAGDEVDIRDEGLYINGSLQLESNIYEITHRYAEGVEFPLTVGKGQIFVLGDSRENSTDSRIFGPVDIDRTYGKVIAVIRTRGV